MCKRESHLAKILLELSHSMTNVIIHNKENPGTPHVSVPLIDHEAAVGTLGVGCDVPRNPDIGRVRDQSQFVGVLIKRHPVEVFGAFKSKASKRLRLGGGGDP